MARGRTAARQVTMRIGADVGSAVTIYDNADVFPFRAAVTSPKVMKADPPNIAHRPRGIFVSERSCQ